MLDTAHRTRTWLSRRRAGTLPLALLLLVLRLAVPEPATLNGGSPLSEAGAAELLGDVPICHVDLDQAPSKPGGKPVTALLGVPFFAWLVLASRGRP